MYGKSYHLRYTSAFLFGSEFSVADAYLYVMLQWGRMKGLDLPEPLLAFAERMNTRPFVRLALQHEGWLDAALPAPGGENPSHPEN